MKIGMVPARPIICISANTSWYVFNFRGRLISTLIDQGFDVFVLSPHDSYVPKIEALGARHVHIDLDSSGTNPLRDGVAFLRIASILRRHRPAMLLTYTPKVNIYGSLAAMLLGIPCLANVAGLGRAFVAGGWLEYLARLLYRIALRHPQVVFFQNENDHNDFINAGLVSAERAKRLPGSGVDVDRFSPRVAEENSEQPFVFILAARMLWDKGVREFVEAARQIKATHPDVEFRLVGFLAVKNPSAISREQVDAWVSEGVVTYYGPSDAMTEVYAAADCMVLPSVYREGVPRTLLEAASMGLPIITTNTVGCRDTVEDGVTGFLCRPKDPDDLADKMRRMLALSYEQRRAMGLAGRNKMIREFDERIVLEAYLKSIKTVLSSEC